MIKIKTEVGVAAILVIALFVAILLVVGFDKTIQDVEKIQKANEANQKMLNGQQTPVIK